MSTNTSPNTACECPGTTARKILESSHYHLIRQLRCTFHNGVLTLGGELPTYHMKQVAQTAVQQIDGVLKIVNGIRVTT